MADYVDLGTFSQMQGNQSRQVGAAAADLADPFATERGRYKNALRSFMDAPSASPAYKFAYEQGLDAINRRAAATGKTGSGNYLADLMRFGQGLASQDYYKQGNFLAHLAGVDSSSPAAAALSLTGGFNRGQDQDSIAAVAKRLGSGGGQQSTPWWEQPMQMPTTGSQSAGWTSQGYGTGMPGGGYSIPAAYSPYTGPGYLPSGGGDMSGSGGGYGDFDYGSGFDSYGSGGGGDWSNFDPVAYAEQDSWGYE